MSKQFLKASAAAFSLVTAASGHAMALTGDNQAVDSGVNVPSSALKQHGIDAYHGSLDAFWGSLDAFWGGLNSEESIDSFWGGLNGEYGSLDAFYGSLDAFWGSLDAFYGSLDAFYGSLDAFWGSLDAFYGSLDAFTGDPDALRTELRGILDQSEASFGAAVAGRTGNSFQQEIVDPLLSKYGIGDGLTGAEDLSREQYASFLIELHDRLMMHTGLDHVDHWMEDINWSPALAEEAGSGRDVVVGLLDTPITRTDLIGGTVQETNGFGLSTVDHGAGVASVLAGAHDGRGVMGVAPEANFLVFNPFDSTFTASWNDVTEGISELSLGSDASIINMSLGVKGYTLHPEWATVFNDWNAGRGTLDTLLVKSAGNSGVSQTQDVNFWFSAAPYNLIIVGSVNPNGEISTFSNRPGTACMISWFRCREENKLMNRFLVAPGEMILVEDNEGNLTRASGTSLAAPLVSGAAALVQSKWAWLKNSPAATADILLETATDLGAPGPDEVYGRGLLNVEAALQPIDSTLLYIDTGEDKVFIGDVGGMTLELLGILPTDETVTVFEDIRNTKRDFEIPVTQLSLTDTAAAVVETVTTTTESLLSSSLGGSSKWSRWRKWSRNSDDRDDFTSGFTDLYAIEGGKFGSVEAGWQGMLIAEARPVDDVVESGVLPFQLSARIMHNQSGVSVAMGQGNAALAFSGSPDFGLTSDHSKRRGGVNPILGLASGDFFAGTTLPIGDRAHLSLGYTENTDRNGYRDAASGDILDSQVGLADYSAKAVNLKFGIDLGDHVTLDGGYTRLNEDTGLLGGQGAGLFSLEGGSLTDAFTLQASSWLGNGVTLSVSATTAVTDTTQYANSLLGVEEGGLQSTAFQITGTKRGLLGKDDALRVTLSQPLHIENGALSLNSVSVTDRATGETALVQDTIALDQSARRLVSEVVYQTPLRDGRAMLNTFGIVETNNIDSGEPRTVVSGGVRLEFKF